MKKIRFFIKWAMLCMVTLHTSQNLVGQDNTLVVKLKEHVTYLASDSLAGRCPGTPESLLAQKYIAEEFKLAGIKPFNGKYIYPFDFRHASINLVGNNIVGIIEGSDPELKNEYIVIGAHYDHVGWKWVENKKVVFNGADDNASGVAGIIEIGRMLKSTNTPLKRSIIVVAFDAEETGLNGSIEFLKDPAFSPLKIKAMFSVDMIGMYKANKGVDMHGAKSIVGFDKVLTRLEEENKITISNSQREIELRTDTRSFGERGIPSVHVFTGLKSPYHKPEDDSDLLDYDGMAKIVGLNVAVLNHLSNQGKIDKIKMLEGDNINLADGKRVKFGACAGLGSSHNDYTNSFYRSNAVFAADLGMFMQVRLSNRFSLQPEILYSTHGGQITGGSIRSHSAQIPINLLYALQKLEVGSIFALFGPYYNYNLSLSSSFGEIKIGEGYAEETWGLNTGILFDIMSVQVGFLYKIGVGDLQMPNNNGEIVNNSAMLKLGYSF